MKNSCHRFYSIKTNGASHYFETENTFGKVNMNNRHYNYRQHTFQMFFQETRSNDVYMFSNVTYLIRN